MTSGGIDWQREKWQSGLGSKFIDVCKAVEEMMNESEERGELRMLIKNIINASYSRDLSTKIAAADHLKMCWQAMQNEP